MGPQSIRGKTKVKLEVSEDGKEVGKSTWPAGKLADVGNAPTSHRTARSARCKLISQRAAEDRNYP